MKKLFVICALILFATTVYADGYKTCKVSGTNGSVVVNSYDTEEGAIVTFSNDTDEYVNVTAEISFYGNGINRTITKMVAPHSESTVTVEGSGRSIVLIVSGTKCEK